MSVIYFKSLYPDARIVAFEADPYIFSFLEKNIQSYNFKDVTLNNKAVWNTNDEVLSFLAEGGAGGRLQEKSDQFKFVDIKTARLKDYLTQKVDFLKIDIEGAEYKVLADCADSLKLVKNLFIEYHSMANDPQNLHLILQIVHDAGFRYHIKEAYATPYPFIERKLNFGMDLQLNIFCYPS
jgi:FkbM family methyltransferase